MQLSREAVNEWLAHPVTEALRRCVTAQAEGRKAEALAAYWQGRPLPEADRIARRMIEQFVDEVFAPDVDDLNAILREIDEQERD